MIQFTNPRLLIAWSCIFFYVSSLSLSFSGPLRGTGTCTSTASLNNAVASLHAPSTCCFVCNHSPYDYGPASYFPRKGVPSRGYGWPSGRSIAGIVGRENSQITARLLTSLSCSSHSRTHHTHTHTHPCTQAAAAATCSRCRRLSRVAMRSNMLSCAGIVFPKAWTAEWRVECSANL